MRRWIGIPLALVLLAGLAPSAWANSELHTGGRLFYPLWDVSNPSRLTFIIVTREALNEEATISTSTTSKGTINNGLPTFVQVTTTQVRGTPGNCLPRGVNGSATNINRASDTSLGSPGGTVFVDDVHFQWYGKSCEGASEVVHMSCADIDLFILAHPNNPNVKPRFAFQSVADEGRGALDVHLITNTLSQPNLRKEENSLMGHAIITDLGEGWAATYPAAAAKATTCFYCGLINGTQVGYENYPMEVFLPFALAEPGQAPGGALRNVLSLWGPAFLPGTDLSNTSLHVDFKWWDGRERFFIGDRPAHSFIAPLGGDAIAGLDSPLDSGGFNVANFRCGHAVNPGEAENDGFPRVEATVPSGICNVVAGQYVKGPVDTIDPSDNFESAGANNNALGHRIQGSTPIGWWRFALRRDSLPPSAFVTQFAGAVDHSGRGLVGVVLTSTPGAAFAGVGDATRLWHKDPCELSQGGSSLQVIGPPHLKTVPATFTDFVPIFNVFKYRSPASPNQRAICGFGD